jgi:hypothetical protein
MAPQAISGARLASAWWVLDPIEVARPPPGSPPRLRGRRHLGRRSTHPERARRPAGEIDDRLRPPWNTAGPLGRHGLLVPRSMSGVGGLRFRRLQLFFRDGKLFFEDVDLVLQFVDLLLPGAMSFHLGLSRLMRL